MKTMFTNSLQNGQSTIQYQTADGTILKQPKIEGQKSSDYPTFCYTTAGNGATVNLAQLAASDDSKTCYIAQPIGPYNYALVNQMQLAQNGIATVDNQGRLQVVNKPLTNTISNISFKCDVCGLMFSHLTLLNHHKRMHNQSSDNQDGSITVVAQNGQNILQGQTLVSETGQPLGQIQIVATDSLEPASSQHVHQQQHSLQEVTVSNKGITLEKGKCSQCGTAIMHASGKRKNTKVRCENCITNGNNTNNHLNVPRSTQIFVAADGDVKFEMSDMPESDASMDSMDQQIIHLPGGQQIVQIQQSQQMLPPSSKNHHGLHHHPVKKRNAASMAKCQKCNGSGMIFIGINSKQIKQEHPKPFTCNICGGTFSRYSSLWSHKKLHSGEKNYKCEVCGLAFAKAVYLKNHSRIHTGEKPYKCSLCDMQFSQSPHLKNHERTHSGEKPYVCEVCDKGFARHATLWNHRRIHTGEKPYKCETCGSAFSQAAHLKNHAKVHSGEKPFKCQICSAAFADRFALKRHNGIHEKYGQTAPKQHQTKLDNNNDPLMIQKHEIPDLDVVTTEIII